MRVEKVRNPEGEVINHILVGDDFIEVENVSEFIRYLRVKNYSPNTLKNYVYGQLGPVLKKFRSFIGNSPYLIGHNVSFDYSILEDVFSRWNIPEWQGQLICTEQIARKRLKGLVSNRKLLTLTQYFGIPHERPHRAESDAKATWSLLVHLLEKSPKQESGQLSLF